MKRFIITVAFILSASLAQAQAIFISPTSQLQWDIVVPDVPTAQSLTYSVSIDLATPVILTGVTCAVSNPLVAGTQTCSILLTPQIPVGTHSITLTASSGVLVSAASAPLAYIDLLIPVPKNLRVK